MNSVTYIKQLLGVGLFFLMLGGSCIAAQDEEVENEQEKTKGPPPSLVVVSEITGGDVEPMLEFVGTVFYSRVSKVASEVEGLVVQADFEEGQKVEADKPLVGLGTDILDSVIKGTRGTYEQVQVELEQAQKNLNRIDPLYKDGSVSEMVYDEHFYKVKSLQRKAVALKAALDRLLIERDKKTIKAPFSGAVVEKLVEKGEWVPVGGSVAVIADNSEVDVVIDVPAEMLNSLKQGRVIEIKSSGNELSGKFISFIPKGDVATRTFSIKLRLVNTANLIEGMEARALMPTAEKRSGLVVPRDAVIDKFGQSVIFVVEDATAKMIPVNVVGFNGLSAGISGPGLEVGQSVVVKGNERLRDGQPVRTAK